MVLVVPQDVNIHQGFDHQVVGSAVTAESHHHCVVPRPVVRYLSLQRSLQKKMTSEKKKNFCGTSRREPRRNKQQEETSEAKESFLILTYSLGPLMLA